MYLTYRRVLAVAAGTAAVAGIGGTALATSGTPSTAGKPASSSHAKAGKHGGAGKLLKHLDHAQIVSHGKGDKTVTRTLWAGSVTAVSPTSVTVQAADKKTQTYTVTKDTKIREKAKGKKPADSSIAKIAKGDRVFVSGTGTSTVTAKRILELPKK